MSREFDRQVENLIRKGYPSLTGLQEGAFLRFVTPLQERLSDVRIDGTARIPFVIVISNELAPTAKAIALVELRGKRGFTVRAHLKPAQRSPGIVGVSPESGDAGGRSAVTRAERGTAPSRSWGKQRTAR